MTTTATRPRKAPVKAKAKAPQKVARDQAAQPGGSLGDAITVLKRHRGKAMTPQAIYDVGCVLGLFASLKGKTPVATLQAQLAVANKNGQHVERTAPGRYKIRKAAPAAKA